jgi:hypothetical protein
MNDRTKEPRLFPVQIQRGYSSKPARIRESVYMAAYEVYSHVYAPQEEMIDLEGRGCRGGFSSGELVAFLYARSFPRQEWSARVDEAWKGMEGL